MSAINNYFFHEITGAFRNPILRGHFDRQYVIGRIVQSLLISGAMFGLYYAITAAFAQDPIQFFKDHTACQITTSVIGGLALGYIVWGKLGDKEKRQIVKKALLAAGVPSIMVDNWENAASESFPNSKTTLSESDS